MTDYVPSEGGSMLIKSRWCPTSQVEGYVSLRYAPREPKYIAVSTDGRDDPARTDIGASSTR